MVHLDLLVTTIIISNQDHQRKKPNMLPQQCTATNQLMENIHTRNTHWSSDQMVPTTCCLGIVTLQNYVLLSNQDFIAKDSQYIVLTIIYYN